MDKKTYIITGGNTGIGKAIALALAEMEAHVVIISRNQQKGDLAVTDIQNLTQQKTVDLVVGNLGSVASTHQLADTLLEKYPKINGLINNAGLWMAKRELNEDGLELSFMVNHLAPFILSNRLLPCLKANAPARIVNVNAGLYIKGKLDLDKTPYGLDFSRLGSYANTKLCNVLFTRALAKRIEDSGVTVNAVHPGVIQTNLGNTSGIIGAILRLIKRSWSTPEEGAKAPVWLATSPDVEGVNGQYFDLQTKVEVSEIAQDDTLADKLWHQSIKLAKLEDIP